MSQDVQFKQQLEALKNQRGEVDADAEHEPETARQASNAGLRREAGVQRKATGAAGGDAQNVAARGVQGSGGQLPHMDRIQASFGAHDVSGIQAHTGGQAAEASQALGAQAYATGSDVAFAGQPDLHTAAHEAAHVVQQRQGVQLKGGVGAAGDAHERKADEVADRVVAGKPAGDLLGVAKNDAAPAQAGPVQMKATPQEAHQKSDVESSESVEASLTLFAKHLHGVEKAFDTRLKTPSEGGGDYNEIVGHYNAVKSEAEHMASSIGISELDSGARLRLSHQIAAIKGAWDSLKPKLQAGLDWVVKTDPTVRNTEFIHGVIVDLALKTGQEYATMTGSSKDPDGSEKTLHESAISEHLQAARGALDSVAAGNKGDAKRIVTHVTEVSALSKNQVAPMKAHKDELKSFATDLKALEKSHPDVAEVLKSTETQIEALKKLTK